MAITPPISPETIDIKTSDPAEFELTLRPWELLCYPQCAGDFRHSITGIRTEKCYLYRERYNLPVKLQGLSPEGMLCLGAFLGYGHTPTLWGKGFSTATMPLTGPGALDTDFGPGHSELIAIVGLELLRKEIPEEDYERLQSAARNHMLQLHPELVGAFSRWGNRLLNAIGSGPKIIENPVFVDDIFETLINFLLRISAQLPPPRPVSSLATRKLALLQALEYLRDRLDQRISVADLCRITGVSERTLQYAFHDEYGISPTEFMRRRRLHAVRQKLITSSAEHSSVSQVALEHGFYELGRFAGEYRKLFGMHPSDSLRSRCRKTD